MALLIVLYTQESACVCIYMCVYMYVCVCLPPGNDVKYSAIVKAFERNSRDYLFTRRPFPIFILLQPSLSPSSSSSSFFLFFIAGVWTPVARNTSRFWRFALCDQFQFQLLKVFKVNSPAMDSPLCVVFLLSFFSLFFPPPPPEGKLSLTQSTKLFYNFSSIFFSLFPPLFTRIE